MDLNLANSVLTSLETDASKKKKKKDLFLLVKFFSYPGFVVGEKKYHFLFCKESTESAQNVVSESSSIPSVPASKKQSVRAAQTSLEGGCDVFCLASVFFLSTAFSLLSRPLKHGL